MNPTLFSIPIRSATPLFVFSLFLGCGDARSRGIGGGVDPFSDAAIADLGGAPRDAAARDFASFASTDALAPTDLATPDLAGPPDLRAPPDFATPPDLVTPPDLAKPTLITGGPCLSGAKGATAFRIRWTDGGGKATVNYEVNGLPDKTRWKASAYGYNFGFTPMFVDPFLGSGGLQLDGSDFVDIELSTVGLASITSATLSIFGRSYNVNTNGSFNWMTFSGSGATPINFVSNAAPYKWYAGDATASFAPADGGVLLRIKAGGNSGSLVVNRIELCMVAQ